MVAVLAQICCMGIVTGSLVALKILAIHAGNPDEGHDFGFAAAFAFGQIHSCFSSCALSSLAHPRGGL